MTTVVLDIETVPCADKVPFVEEARKNFKAPSSLTKAQAGADLGLPADEIKFTSAGDLTARWEREMAEKKAPQVADEAWRKTALDGTKGRIVSIAWEAHGEMYHVCQNPEHEHETLRLFTQMLADQLGPHGVAHPAYFVGHNLVFDLKFLFRRCVILGVRPPFELPFRGRHGHDYFCTMQAWCEYGERISLDNLCQALGIQGKDGMDGSQVCDYWIAGRYKEIAEYNEADVRRARAVYQALNFNSGARAA